MKRVFITGGTGFIGKHLVDALLAHGATCVCLVRASSRRSHLERPGVDLVVGSIDTPQSYASALSGCDTAIHLAGLTQALTVAEFERVNGLACGFLADACIAAGVARVVYISSLAAAGPPPDDQRMRVETDPELPVSDYGRSKLMGEQEFAKRADRLAVTILRPGVVYGPDDHKFGQLVQAIARWRIHFVIGRNDPKLSLIHVDDLAALILLAALKGETLTPPSTITRAGEVHPGTDSVGTDAVGAERESGASQSSVSATGIYFACDDREFISYGDLGRRVAAALAAPAFVWRVRRPVGFAIGWTAETFQRLWGRASFLNVDKVREATAPSWTCSSEKARRQLGFEPAATLDDHLPHTVATYVGRDPAKS